ncbi:ATP-binding protein [Cellulomonas cellasea]|uniref:ATP-binding protein n=1 Tax=Cellulomonas cellasea TaxID=43670 RepID=UPI0025A35E70|nr:ATP-binding protein [Cellulomonas cellasea]MDM8084885.1 ATP-binding protein [Cellulomonas cellasea]
MPGLQSEADDAVARLRLATTDLQWVEAKRAEHGLPQSLAETVSAFANAGGGLILLGLDEAAGFTPVGIDPRRLADGIAQTCADAVEPPIRAHVDIVAVDGQPVVAARIEELPADRKPCYVKTRGIERGSYLRTHDGDRRLTTYEVHVLHASHGQPRDDMAPVEGASRADLDPELVSALVRRLRGTRGPVFARASDHEILRMVGVLTTDGTHERVTLAGLLALGVYPQQYVPQLDTTFVVYPTNDGRPLGDGTRFLDNQSIDGPIPYQVSSAVEALMRNMRRRSIVVGLGREERWEYPTEALREIIANALMHRDYHPLAHGTQVRIELYPDRLVVTSPGGLHGPIATEDLLSESVSSSRNAVLAKLLEDVQIPGSARTICENRGSGLLATAAMLRSAGMEPPILTSDVRSFRVELRNHGLLDDDATAWLSTLDTMSLNDRQRLGLAYLRRHEQLSNAGYRSLTGCDALTATRELSTMAAGGFIDRTSSGRWTIWHLAPAYAASIHSPLTLDLPTLGGDRPGASSRREQVVTLLRGGPRSTSDLATTLGLSPQAVLRHLRILEDAGIVRPTAASRRSPLNAWTLVGGAAATSTEGSR